MRYFLSRFALPLQALVALGSCLGMAWMIVIMAGFNPVPPTALDIRAQTTEDLSFASMNSTAAALAMNMVAELVPSPIVMPVTGGNSSTPTPTLVVTLRAVFTAVDTPTPTSLTTRFFQPTDTQEPRPAGPTRTPTNTLVPTATLRPPTLTPTNTLVPTATTRPPTLTPSLVPTTLTPVPPTNTPITPTIITPEATEPSPTEEIPPTPTDEPQPTPTPRTPGPPGGPPGSTSQSEQTETGSLTGPATGKAPETVSPDP